MDRTIPDKLIYFLKNGPKDSEDGYEYASELNRILNSDDCQHSLSGKEIELLRDYAEKIRKLGELDYYTEERIKDTEHDIFGTRGIIGFLGGKAEQKPQWPF
ncbi:MAG: hypothetical protein Q8935_22785 [Bacillota bacterium]|nr:hypothetical protein [Bacillota bacterium]